MHENRETSVPTSRGERNSPAGEGRSRTIRMNGAEESDCVTVPMNQPNKEKQFSEVGEGRTDQREHRSAQHEPDTERGTSVPGTARCATSRQGKEAGTLHCFASHLSVSLLRDSFYALKRQAAPGVDGVTWREYETGLEDRFRTQKTADVGRAICLSPVQASNPIARSGQTGLLLDGSKEPVADAASSGRVPNHHASNREAMAVSSPSAPVATRACCLRSVAERVSMGDWGHFNQANSRFTLKLSLVGEICG
jgi:hypothetical protein